MKTRITVTFDITFDSAGKGKSTSEVRFALPDYPGHACPEEVKRMVIDQIQTDCTMLKLAPQLFRD